MNMLRSKTLCLSLRSAAALALLLGLALTTTPARAELHPSVRAHSGAMFLPGSDYDLVSEGNGLSQLGLSSALEVNPLLELQLALTGGGSSSGLFTLDHAALAIYSLELSAGTHYALVGPLMVGARLGLNADLGKLTLSPGSMTLGDWATGLGVVGLAGLGLEVPLPGAHRGELSGRSFTLAVEGGYLWRFLPLNFNNLRQKTTRSPDIARIPIAAVNIGKLHLSGALIRLSAGLRF